jgi:hypothetical protein
MWTALRITYDNILWEVKLQTTCTYIKKFSQSKPVVFEPSLAAPEFKSCILNVLLNMSFLLGAQQVPSLTPSGMSALKLTGVRKLIWYVIIFYT